MHVAPRPVDRLIPARAGKTPATTRRPPPGRAHPRACGENSTMTHRLDERLGSSPRVRGKQGAGPSAVPTLGAHPRACGENSSDFSSSSFFSGSSPRVRGKPTCVGKMFGCARLIPARAGKTGASRSCPLPSRAHPRACGENTVRETGSVLRRGSSPRVRGKPGPCSDPPTPARLIPARAGKTSTPTSKAYPRRAHPRACGENNHQTLPDPPHWGSSPRVRGKPLSPLTPSASVRLIPARAGKTQGPSRFVQP